MSGGGDQREPEANSEESPLDTVFFTPREGRLRTPWRLGVWLVALVLASTGGLFVQRAIGAIPPDGAPRAVAAVVGAIGMYAIITAATLLVARRLDHRPLRGLGLGGEDFRATLTLGLVLGILMTTVVFLVGLASGLVDVLDVLVAAPTASIVPGATEPIQTVGDLQPLTVIALMALFFVAVGVAEEVLVRGYLLTNVAEGLADRGPITPGRSVALATLLTGGLFGVLHLANPNATVRSAVLIAAVGVVLGWTYAATGDLGVPIGIHITWNFTLGSIYGFPVSGLAPPAAVFGIERTGSDLLTGGAFGPEAGLIVVLPLALAVAITAWWVRRRAGSVTLVDRIARRQSRVNHER